MNELLNAINKINQPISEMTIVQIGANDGKQSDPVNEIIRKYNNISYLCEPIPEYYKILKNQYNSYPNVKCYNIAITTLDGQAEMTYLKPNKDLPEWTRGLGTLDIKGNYLGEGRAGFKGKEDRSNTELYKKVKKLEEKIQVNTQTLNTFLTKNNIQEIDVFVTDVEGYDWVVFDQLDLEKYHPKVIYMETHFLSDEDNKKIDEKLHLYGYTFTKGWDTIAIKNKQ